MGENTHRSLRFGSRVAALAFATALHAVIAALQILLATRVLSASDFGVYGVVMAVVVLAGALCNGGAGLLLPRYLATSTAAERARLIASLAAFETAGGLVLAGILLAAWPVIRAPLGVSGSLPAAIALVAALLIPLRALTQVASVAFSVSGRGDALALQVLAQSLTGFVVVVAALFGFGTGVFALFAGSLCGQIAALAVGVWLIGLRTMFARPSRMWLGRIVRTAPTATISLLLDAIWGVAENAIVSATRGLGSVGIWVHARLYNNLLAGAVGSVSHNAWSLSLAEARDPQSDFAATRRVWGPVHVLLTAFGLLFAFTGEEIVDLLTNGKLTSAAVYVPYFAIIMLLRNAARGATAVIYAGGRGPLATRIRAAATLAGLLLLYPAIARYGLAGIIALLVAVECIDVAAARVLSSRDTRVRWHLAAVAGGVGAIAAASAAVHVWEPAVQVRLALLASAWAAVAVAGRRPLRDVLDTAHSLLAVRPNTLWSDSSRAER